MHSVSLNDSYFQYFHCFCYIAVFLENNNNFPHKHMINFGRLEENYMNFLSGVAQTFYKCVEGSFVANISID